MPNHELAAALQRAETVFRRRPDMGMHEDAPASARWERDTRVVVNHANGTQIASDMPCELGGTGDRITPGWLFRAGVAACATTTIAMAAAARGIELSALEVQVSSRSDTRGILGMDEADGERVFAGPSDVQLRVRIASPAVSPEQLRALIEEGLRRSPIPNVLQTAMPMAVHVEVA
jgi:uncharacterized OsmC-like protein